MGRWLLEPQANAPADANPDETRGGIHDTYFDTNMVIILAALLCALICALSLNSALRCMLRITRRFTSDDQVTNASNANANSERLAATTGIKRRELEQIPVGLYGSWIIDIKATECLICLGDFVEGEKVRVLPKCKHGFHVMCIDTWLVSRSSCPTCRQSLLLEQPSRMADSQRDADMVVSII